MVNYTLKQLLTTITEHQVIEKVSSDDVIKFTWTKILIERDGILFVRALRKAGKYDESYTYHEKLNTKYPNSQGLQSEALWLKFSSKVCNANNSDYQLDAHGILDKTSQTNPETKLIYEITTLIVMARLMREGSYGEVYAWTSKLNPLLLSDQARIDKNERHQPSNRHQFYNYKARSLINTHRQKFYVNWVFEYLQFTEQKREDFVNHVISSCTFSSYDSANYISDIVLSNFLYQFDVDLVSTTANLPAKSSQPNAILLSELGQYLFCPVSFVLNKSFNIPTHKPMDSSSKWLGSKDGFYERYLQYQKHQNITTCFEYDSFETKRAKQSLDMPDEAISIFEELFKSSIKINNTFNTAPQAFSSDDKMLKGAPDYLLELSNGKRVIISEKFSAASSVGASKVYDSDIIDLEAYLTKFKLLKIDHAYFINWSWSIHAIPGDIDEPDTNIQYVNKVKIERIDLSNSRENLVDDTAERIKKLTSGNILPFKDIRSPNKCLNCSVYYYCEHKSGRNTELKYPYNVTRKVI